MRLNAKGKGTAKLTRATAVGPARRTVFNCFSADQKMPFGRLDTLVGAEIGAVAQEAGGRPGRKTPDRRRRKPPKPAGFAGRRV